MKSLETVVPKTTKFGKIYHDNYIVYMSNIKIFAVFFVTSVSKESMEPNLGSISHKFRSSFLSAKYTSLEAISTRKCISEMAPWPL